MPERLPAGHQVVVHALSAILLKKKQRDSEIEFQSVDSYSIQHLVRAVALDEGQSSKQRSVLYPRVPVLLRFVDVSNCVLLS